MFGGATDKFPIDKSNNSINFFNTHKLFLITAHGRLKNTSFAVPENTYILNMVAAGKECGRETFELDNFKYDYDSKNSMRHKIFDAIQNSIFLKDLMYKPADTNNKNTINNSLAIYEPGDIMQDTDLQFTNLDYPVVALGMYELPMPLSIKLIINNENNHYFRGEYGIDDPIKEYYNKEFNINNIWKTNIRR